MIMNYLIEFEEDGRRIAKVVDIPGVLASDRFIEGLPLSPSPPALP